MKKLLFILSILSFSFASCQMGQPVVKEISDGKVVSESGQTIPIKGYNDPEAVTFFIVRHAEKVDSSDDAELSEEGKARAQRLAEMLKGVTLDLATSTNYKRTTQTANPTVFGHKDCSISVYNPDDMASHFDKILNQRKGQKVLVIGHSNTVPSLLNLLSGAEVYSNIDDDDYSRFYIATVTEMGKASIVEFEY